MKVVILAGGFGTRISEETINIPKPMIEIGGRPILWHIIKIYTHYGFKDFIIALGYKSDYIKKFFLDTINFSGDIKIEFKDGVKNVLCNETDDINLELIDTGINTNTGGRLKFLKNYLDETFLFTYGDGLADINIKNLLDFHKKNKKLVTVTAVHPPARFGSIIIKNGLVEEFSEKPIRGEGLINGGFMVFEPSALNFIDSLEDSLESILLEKLSKKNELCGFLHNGFWQCMDTKRDKDTLEQLWTQGNPPWKVWK